MSSSTDLVLVDFMSMDGIYPPSLNKMPAHTQELLALSQGYERSFVKWTTHEQAQGYERSFVKWKTQKKAQGYEHSFVKWKTRE